MIDQTSIKRSLSSLGLALPLALAPPLASATMCPPAQEPPAQEPDATRASAWMPMAEATSWTYRRVHTDHAGERHVGTTTALVWGAVPASADGETCTQVLTRRDPASRAYAQYWRVTAEGVFELENARLGSGRGGSSSARPARLLAAPVGAESEWKWTSTLSYQTSSSGGGFRPRRRNPEADLIHHTAELVDFDGETTVPAGKFRCTQVRITSTHQNWTEPQVRELWFGYQVGIVRETQTYASGSWSRELVSFQPGVPRPRDPRATLVAHLRKLHGEDVELDFHWPAMRPQSFYLHGRFVAFRAGDTDELQSAYVDDAVEVFEVSDLAFWNARLTDLCREWPSGPDEPATVRLAVDQHVRSLASLMARTEALRRGCSDLKTRASTFELTVDEGVRTLTYRIPVSATDDAGRTVDVIGILKAVGETITAATVEISAH